MHDGSVRSSEKSEWGQSVEPFIRAYVLTIDQVYSGRYKLDLPWFQRAYAWGEEHVGRLVKDVVEAMSGPLRRYSIGHMSLAKPGPQPDASLVDGHQRSITLTMFFAILRDVLAGTPIAARLHNLIEAPDGGGYRLSPQPGVAEFFATYVQSAGATTLEPRGDIMDLSPNERNIIANRDHMRRMLLQLGPTPDKLIEIASFLIDRCVVIVDEVEDRNEAWALLTREEERGLSPHSSELAKVTILSSMRRDLQEQASRLFERAQALLSADNLTNVLAHIRTLKVRKRSSKPVDRELIQQFEMHVAGLEFLENELLPRAEAMASLISRTVGSGTARAETARSLETLSWLDNQLWMPPALHWLSTVGADHPETPKFFARLDRLAYVLKIASVDPTDQELHYLKLIEAIDDAPPVDRIAPLDIKSGLLASALANLRSKTFYAKRFHALVLRRISCNLAPDRDPGPVDGKMVTVEHILPRKPEPGQRWLVDFRSLENVGDYCNRLGNLAFLTLEVNNIAANQDFVVKRLILAQSAGSFVLSKHASDEMTWTPATIERRTEELIAILLRTWQLSP